MLRQCEQLCQNLLRRNSKRLVKSRQKILEIAGLKMISEIISEIYKHLKIVSHLKFEIIDLKVLVMIFLILFSLC